MTGSRYFTPETFRFLKDLADHNDRAWFSKNKGRYEDVVKVPALSFIQDFAALLADISPHFTAGPRSLFRIHRDTRFSKDKRPYKTHTGIQFRHDAAKDVHAPGYYLHIEPGNVFVGLGLWHPDGPALRKIRDAIVDDPAGWKRVSRGKRFSGAYSLTGDRLSRPPRGFDQEHPLIEDLKWKDFMGIQRLTEGFVTDPALPRKLAGEFRKGSDFMAFLCSAVDVSF